MRAKLRTPVDLVKGFAFSHSAFNSTQGDIEVVSTFLPPTTVRCGPGKVFLSCVLKSTFVSRL